MRPHLEDEEQLSSCARASDQRKLPWLGFGCHGQHCLALLLWMAKTRVSKRLLAVKPTRTFALLIFTINASDSVQNYQFTTGWYA